MLGKLNTPLPCNNGKMIPRTPGMSTIKRSRTPTNLIDKYESYFFGSTLNNYNI